MGADLVPVYHLGQTQLLTFWGTEQISRKWRASVGLFWGAYGLPLPRKHQIITLAGPPIPGKLSRTHALMFTFRDLCGLLALPLSATSASEGLRISEVPDLLDARLLISQ